MKFTALIFLITSSCLLALEPNSAKDPFKIIEISEVDGDLAILHLDQMPSSIVFPEDIKYVQQAEYLVYQKLNFTSGPKRIGVYKGWILFPRLDVAKDDLSFKSGYAVRIGSRILLHWNTAEQGAAANP